MVRFHMVDDKILDGTFADYALYLPKIYLKVTNIYSINQRNRFIVYQVRVVRLLRKAMATYLQTNAYCGHSLPHNVLFLLSLFLGSLLLSSNLD